jgi:hypothetical protein
MSRKELVNRNTCLDQHSRHLSGLTVASRLYCVVSMWRSVLIPRIDALDRVPLFKVGLLFSPLLDLCLTGQQSYLYSTSALPVNKAITISHYPCCPSYLMRYRNTKAGMR